MENILDTVMGNISDRVVDSAVETAIDVVTGDSNKVIYVWTAISKETFNNNILNVIFCNKEGYRQRVAYDKLSKFLDENYVSNLTLREGKVEFIGVSEYEVPNYKLGTDGQFKKSGSKTEQQIYDKSLAQIQIAEEQLRKDSESGNLKGKVKSGLGSTIMSAVDISDNIRATSEAVALTAVTAAGTAAITGVGVAAKSVYKAINKKKLIQVQQEVYNKLKIVNDILNDLAHMKQLTNTDIQQNNILKYTNAFEVQHSRSQKYKKDFEKFGVVGTINKMKEILKSSIDISTANKILNERLVVYERDLGTLNTIIEQTQRRITDIENLHQETKRLVTLNKQRKQNLNLLDDLRRDIGILEADIDSYTTANIYNTGLQNLQSEFIRIRDTANQTNNEQYIGYELSIVEDKLVQKVRYESSLIVSEINRVIEKLEEELKRGLRGEESYNDYVRIIGQAQQEEAQAQVLINRLDGETQRILISKLGEINSRVEASLGTVKDISEKLEKDLSNYNNINVSSETYINKMMNDALKYCGDYVVQYKRAVQQHINNIKSQYQKERAEEFRDRTVARLEEIYRNRLDEENRQNEYKLNTLNQIKSRLNQELARLRNLDTAQIRLEDIGEQEGGEEFKSLGLRYNEYEVEQSEIRQLIKDVNKEKSDKTRELNRQKDYKEALERKLGMILDNIIRLNERTMRSVGMDIEALGVNINYTKLVNIAFKQEIDTQINTIKMRYEDKKRELGLS